MDDIGKILKQTRENKKLTLDEISKETHILTRYLNAIEEGNYSIVPDRIYVIGIIRKYADYLGLDGSQMVKTFVDSINSAPRSQVQKKEKLPRHSMNINLRPFITVLTVAVLIGVFVIVIYMNPYRNLNVPTPAPPSPLETQAPPISEAPTPPNMEEPKTPDKLTLTIRFNGDCWIRALDEEGNVLAENKYSAGEEVTLEAKEITLRLGYPGNAVVVLNGNELPPLGKAGTPITKKFTLDDINSQGQTP